VLSHEQRTAEITVHAVADLRAALRLARELDDALLRLRFHHPELGLWLLRTRGEFAVVRALDTALASESWLACEVRALLGRVFKRIENSARSCFALIDEGACFSGTFLELALAADRIYLHADSGALELGALNRGAYPRANGLSRLESRFLGDSASLARVLATSGVLDAEAALALGLATEAPDAIEWDDAIRLAIEERASFSPDALTGLEQNLRFAGPETLETKIFARLSAWQNWIFQRPNASGPDGALRAAEPSGDRTMASMRVSEETNRTRRAASGGSA
jgi:benzoyl-CoA-dihydrodiol lyase